MTTTSSSYQLGLWGATALVVGNVVGSGIFLLPSSIAKYGTTGLLGWVMTAIGSLFLALVFARLSRRFPKIGGPYAYSREAFGDFIGFQMAWSYWVANWVSNAALGIAFVSYLSFFWPTLTSRAEYACGVSLLLVWGLTFINAYGIRWAGSVQMIATVLKLIPLILLGVTGVFHIKLEHFYPLNPSPEPFWSALNMAATLTLFSFMGIESATIPAENVRSPEKTIPRATLLGAIISAVIYIWMMVVLLGITPAHQLADSYAPFADAIRPLFGHQAAGIIAASAALSCFGTLNGWILLQGQVPLAAARDGLFPKAFARVSKHGIPFFGLVISSVLITILILLNYEAHLVKQFTLLVTFTTFAILLPYLYSSLAELVFLAQHYRQTPLLSWLKPAIITMLAFLYSLWAIAGAGKEIIYLGTLFIFGGLPLYAWMKRGMRL